ncbi:glycosyl hydrolase family 95 catalytic domain-containing protein [Gracilibacillus salinarum]|uniref:Glycoside hydrolase N-terminal domain-containing protein n=1 Tax=Gracilibacillus salinarum TaxID=2932255 RepID=A0ABY4GKS6_9BACI|nr:glycoside hydrolase N-terminal domain-containing protein [Gracilibacillus salinarum]UOQ84897.1 glycoside hydrolase N-terminal domain-containing protein [Gracilibacillus salinarum]
MFEEIADRHKLILDYPASWWRNKWREALPAGNGEIGAAVYGAIHTETILLNHSRLWHLGEKGKLPDLSHTLEETRAMMDKEAFEEANWHLTNELKQTGYHSTLQSPLPLIDLTVKMDNEQGFTQYRRGLNMTTGEIAVTWKEESTTYVRELFVSHAEDVVVYRITADRSNAVNAEIGFSLHPTDSVHLKDRYDEVSASAVIESKEPFIYFKATNDKGNTYGAVAFVQTKQGTSNSHGQSITCQNADEVVVLIKVFADTDNYLEQWHDLGEQLITGQHLYDALLQEHLAVYQPLFFSSDFTLSTQNTHESNEALLLQAYQQEAPQKLYEKLWAYGRYLFISGTSESGQPFSMYGLWHGDYRLMWSHRMANENIQMMYWHVNVGGLTGYNQALADYYLRLIDDFRDNAKKLYGCRGIYIPAGTTPDIGTPNQILPVIMNWTAGAGWLAQHFYQYYQFSGDEVFFKDKALPFMKEVALFYQDFLVVEDGYYRYYPSVSPENTPANFMPDTSEPVAHPMPTAMNATMDFAVLKELLTNLVTACQEMDVYRDELPIWKEMLERIPPYLFTETGAIREWMDDRFEENEQHRHLSHLYPIFPGYEQGTDLFQAGRQAVQNRKLGAQTGWSFAHMACIYARLEESEHALKSLEHLMRSCLLPNLYTLHNDWREMGLTMDINTAPVQMDANLGVVNAIQEMLLFVSQHTIKLLPALPVTWECGKVTDFHFCTGTCSFQWNQRERHFSVSITATRPTDIQVVMPDFADRFEWTDGATITASGQQMLHVNLSQGQTIHIFSR